VSVPHDPALPSLRLLLDPEAMAPLLARSLGRPAQLDGVRVGRVAYKPGIRAVVHYGVVVDGREENAVACAMAGRDLARRARDPWQLDLARRVDGRSPAVAPVSYERAANALITWFPFDPELPALAESPRALAGRLARVGLAPPAEVAEPTIVPESYKPGARIVLRFGRHVLKAYGSERWYERGAAALRIAATTPLRTPRLEACLPDLRLTVQSAVEGSTPPPERAAAAAGALVRRLHTSRVEPPRLLTPELVLALAAEKGTLAAHILPELCPRVTRLLERLQASAPVADGIVPTHGDFDADQLVEVQDGDHVVLDFDDVCTAAPAYDPATYLADVVRGSAEDLGAIEAVREPLLTGYGARPPALEWYLAAVVLARAPHPFQRFVSAWPKRVRGMIQSAEEVLEG
jgi:Phosphotransferase enzyme family